ncbi:hypothetical protein ACVME8_001869 [Bradyrhizobium diazoefficiens]
MVGHAGKHRALHRHPSVIGLRQNEETGDGIDEAVSGDHTDRIVDGGEGIRCGCGRGGQLEAGWPVECAVGQQSLQEISDLAAAVRRAQHHDAGKPGGAVSCDVGARDEAAHRMCDEMQRRLNFGETGDRRMNVVYDGRDRLAAAGIVDVKRREPARPERPLQFRQGCRGARDAMKQNHSRTSRAA